jgi:hypothetical protein
VAPDPNDDQGHSSSSLDEVRAWGERRDRAAREAAQRAEEAEQTAAKYRVDAVKSAAQQAGLTEEQLTVLTTMKPDLEPEQVAQFAQTFGIQTGGTPPAGTPDPNVQPQPPAAPQAGAPAAGQPGAQPVEPAPPATAPPGAPVVTGTSTGVPPGGYSTDDFVAAARRDDMAGLERMATEVASGARPLNLKHPDAQPA